ncbi:hypothetical protein EXIGLDRAFT_761269 [Exidia glandulosa HHB12029]|uniref:Uncharacterized protein n=1 Tax=Exidia glandulosa HHB12029 TaxID=1314781 RepID=A0A165NNC4_EXIGL|nr:hypothetical protein EXIGLDRAFT_761269 [Exidia glandulosa HHB12029]
MQFINIIALTAIFTFGAVAVPLRTNQLAEYKRFKVGGASAIGIACFKRDEKGQDNSEVEQQC